MAEGDHGGPGQRGASLGTWGGSEVSISQGSQGHTGLGSSIPIHKKLGYGMATHRIKING